MGPRGIKGSKIVDKTPIFAKKSKKDEWSPAILDFRMQISDLRAQRFAVRISTVSNLQSAIYNVQSIEP